jgi:hypothetical protein
MKQTLKITISPTNPKGIVYRLGQKKMAHPPSHMEKEGGACRDLKTIIKKCIAIKKLTKQNPTHLFHFEGWVG